MYVCIVRIKVWTIVVKFDTCANNCAHKAVHYLEIGELAHTWSLLFEPYLINNKPIASKTSHLCLIIWNNYLQTILN